MATQRTDPRRYDLDWLRAAAVLLLIPFHTARVFNADEDFYVKNVPRDDVSERFIAVVGPWHMSLLFTLAGAATWLAFRSRDGRAYAGERFRRLLVPFAVGVPVLVLPQTWLAYRTHHAPGMSYPEYVPRFFTTADADLSGYAGGFTPGHLWFIAALFVFSLVALPLFLSLHHGRARGALGGAARAWRSPGWLIAIPVALLVVTWFAGRDDLSGQNPIGFLVLFVLGFAVAGAATPEGTLGRHWPWILGLGAVASAAYIVLEPHTGDAPAGVAALAGVKALYELGVWAVILGLLGLARRFACHGGAAWRYASEAAYPFYLLHQTVIVAVAYEAVRWDVASPLKYVVIALASTAGSLVLYEVAVRRWAPMRVLFGMRPRPRHAGGARTATA